VLVSPPLTRSSSSAFNWRTSRLVEGCIYPGGPLARLRQNAPRLARLRLACRSKAGWSLACALGILLPHARGLKWEVTMRLLPVMSACLVALSTAMDGAPVRAQALTAVSEKPGFRVE